MTKFQLIFNKTEKKSYYWFWYKIGNMGGV